MALTIVVATRPARGAPADIFQSPTPTIGSDPQKASDLRAGDGSVSSQTGAMNYSYPIAVPPGRNGAQPHLALTYSSQAPIYGGIAAGWELAIPWVGTETSTSRLLESQTSPTYTSTMSGSQPLVSVDEPHEASGHESFRAQGDSSFTRYQRMLNPGDPVTGPAWLALTPDGTTYLFGGYSLGPSSNLPISCPNIGTKNAPLAQVFDAFGNTITYYYKTGVTNECLLDHIDYGSNSIAVLDDFARVSFVYTAPAICSGVAVGSATDYRSGFENVRGATPLTRIVATAFEPGQPNSPEHTRSIDITYNSTTSSCPSSAHPYSAYRELASITESAWTPDSSSVVALPPVTFTYGSPTPGYNATSSTTPWDSDNYNNISDSNLAYGFKFINTGITPWPTVEGMLIDIDGDGLPDRLRNHPSTTTNVAGGPMIACGAQWQKNLGRNASGAIVFDSTLHSISLPTLKWGVPGNTTPPIFYLNSQVAQPGEICSLNYQRTFYVNSAGSSPCGYGEDASKCTIGGQPVPATCGNKNDCGNAEEPPPPTDTSTVLAYRWIDMDGDGLVDLVAGIGQGGMERYNLLEGTAPPPANVSKLEPLTFGNWPPCPTLPFSGPSSFGTYTMCGGLYPWFVYKNSGNGVFASMPTILYEPIPLETDNGSSSVGDTALTGAAVGQRQGTLDLDGDGFPDAVFSEGSDAYWSVFPNDATGQMSNQFDFHYAGRSGALISAATWDPTTDNATTNTGLFDLNGDGLADHWVTNYDGSGSATGTYDLVFGDGTQFLVGGTHVTLGIKPAVDSTAGLSSTNFVEANELNGGHSNYRTDSTCLLDVDLDGRPDVGTVGSGGTIAFNQGGQLASPVTLSFQDPTAAAGIIGLSDSVGWPYATRDGFLSTQLPLTWQVRSGFVDLDGDGVPEGVSFGQSDHPTGAVAGTMVNINGHPPRLLIGIDNGHGATTAVNYASIHDPIVAYTDPAQHNPKTQWIVKSLTVTDSLASTTSTTTYKYFNPVFNQDYLNEYGFRGFEEVDTIGPSLATTQHRYSYLPDFSGRLTSTLVLPAATEMQVSGEVRTIDDTEWILRDLCDAEAGTTRICTKSDTTHKPTVPSFFASTTTHYSCKNGEDEAACRADTNNKVLTTNTVSPIRPTTGTTATGSQLFAITSSRLQSGTDTSASDDNRTTTTSYVLNNNFGIYRLHPSLVTKTSTVAGTTAVYSKVQTDWDAQTLSVPLQTETWFSNDTQACQPTSDFCAIEARSYDTQTGNLLQRQKPNQLGTTKYRTYTYDPRKLFVVTDTDELGLELDYSYNYGTGTKLTTSGPNSRACATNQTTCLADATHPVKQESMIVVDGLGRTTQEWETTSDDGTYYTLNQMSTITYVDSATLNSVSTQRLVSLNSNVYVKDETDVDGHGRPIKKTVFAQGAAPANEVTTYHYNNDGTLQEVDVPDPTANDTSTVPYTYGYDSLGRARSIRRPLTVPSNTPSGADMSYDGLDSTTIEVVGAEGGLAATTTTHRDAFGRLSSVDETWQTGASPIATTTYDHWPDDNVHTVTDPENVVTTMTHDFAGRRTSITRNTRTWVFTYDKNGNVIHETVPGGITPDDPNYMTSTVYDDLDRPLTKLPAPRSMSSADQAYFATGSETYLWDYSYNRKGLLAQWASNAPGSGTPTYRRLFNYDTQSRPIGVFDYFNMAGYPAYPNMSRSEMIRYTIGGEVWSRIYYDQVGGTNYTSDLINLDARGLPKNVQVIRGGEATLTLAAATRNVAGLVTNQRTTNGTSYIESNWTYDKLGRVTSQLVDENPSATRIAQQSLSYFGNDDPKTMDHYLGASTSHHAYSYTYDSRHQLTQVTEAGNAFGATYTYGAAGRFTGASETTANLSGSDVRARNVAYHYDDPLDHERLTSLTDSSGTYANYAYDEAGNQTSRCYGGYTSGVCNGDKLDMLYDGQDQLRRAKKSNHGVAQGSEEYWYGPGGERVAILKRDAAGNKLELITFTRDVEAHYDASGTVQHIYSYISLGGAVARVDRTSNTTTDVELLFHGLGSSTLAAVNYNGTVDAAFDYTPFGEIVETLDVGGSTDASVAEHRRRFNDKYQDELSDLTYYGARYYDKTAMVWTQGDPLYRFVPDLAKTAGPRRANLYTFTSNNPLRYLDPDGRDPKVTQAEASDPVRAKAWGYFIGSLAAASSGGPSSTGKTSSKIVAQNVASDGYPITNDPTFGIPQVVEAPSTTAEAIGGAVLELDYAASKLTVFGALSSVTDNSSFQAADPEATTGPGDGSGDLGTQLGALSRSPSGPGGPPSGRTLVLGGEGNQGEPKGPNVVNLNNLANNLRAADKIPNLQVGDMTELSTTFSKGEFSHVFGRCMPFSHGEFATSVAEGAFHVLEPGGTVQLNASNGGDWAPYLSAAGFVDVSTRGNFHFGTKP